jgi:glutamate N-acetyltransferase / amino-acid N-acetyltransferase
MNPESPVMHPQPQGFLAAAKNVGIKDETLDMTVIYSTVRARAAAMFTRSRFPGAPVIVGRAHISDGFAQALVVNSKNANVATGQRGIEDAVEMCRLVAGELGIDARDVLPFSTGVIGRHLPMDKIRLGLKGIRDELRPNNLELGKRGPLSWPASPKERG